MSASRTRATRTKPGFTRLYCDVRDCRHVIDGDDVNACRRTGRELGWTREHGKDYCPMHSSEPAATIVFGRPQGGPTHLAQAPPHDRLSWCGVREQFRHWRRPGRIDDVTCKRCLRQIKQDRPLARGGR